MTAPRTLADRIFEAHVVTETAGHPAVLYVDLHLVHEVTSPQAFAELADRGIPVRRPDRTLATMDHAVPTVPGRVASGAALDQLDTLRSRCTEHGIDLLDVGIDNQGIVHVVGPELGRTRPGMTVVCGDSHTSTHGAFGCLAFGIGTSEVGHVLATQCVLQRRSQNMRVEFTGNAGPGVTAKDLALALLADVGPQGGRGHVIEYGGAAVRALGMEGRMTLCNLSIEAGARAGLIAPDDTTFEWLAERPGADGPQSFDADVARWRTLRSDPDAPFDRTVTIDAAATAPWITWGTHPGMGCAIDAAIPELSSVPDDARAAHERALQYMGVVPGRPLLGHPVDVVFIGSCTNGRLSDLRAAANLLRGRRVASGVRMLVVPGSRAVKRAAESEGLHQIFLEGGAEWREPGCSMCIAMNGDVLESGAVCVSTSNRNFEGRQGTGGRTILASPLTATASAVAGAVADPRSLAEEAA